MSRFTAGLIAIVVIAVASFVGFTKFNPFASPYQLEAVFRDANNLNPGSPVRIAGVEVGKVKSIEPNENGTATVKMEIKDEGLPLHEDATLKVRPRIFLEGNFFVDVQPGSPSAPVLEEGEPIGPDQTAAPVQFGDLLSALQSDTRSDLQVFLKEYSKGLEGKGAAGLNQFFQSGGGAFRNLAIASEATLGEEPTKDLQRLLKGQAKASRALVTDENALKNLVTNLNVTAGAFAREDAALEASIPAVNDTLRVGRPALGALNAALPTLRVFAVEALPGVRSTAPTLREARPFIRQARLLVGPNELGGAARELRTQTPRLTRLVRRLVPFLGEVRPLSSCVDNVLVPWAKTPIPNPDEAGNNNELVYRQFNRGLVGLAGESRLSDGNSSWFNTSAIPGLNVAHGGITVRPAAPADLGNQPPPRRPDVACETQEPPNMNAPGGSLANFVSTPRSKIPKVPTKAVQRELLTKAGQLFRKHERGLDKKRKLFKLNLKKRAAEAKR
jgi:virulence factor Mce-like protein